MTNGIGSSSSISLVEEMDGIIPDDCSRSTKSLRFIFGLRRNLTNSLPTFQVLALGNSYIPALPSPSVMRRNAIIHKVSSAMKDYDWVFRKERSSSRIVTINELVSVDEVAEKEEQKRPPDPL